jgi:hypothetical protein
MSAPILPRVLHIAVNVNYDASANPWSGEPTKVLGDGAWISQGAIPARSTPAPWDNYWRSLVSHAVEDAQFSIACRVIASDHNTAATSILACLPKSRQIVRLTGGSPSNLVAYTGAFLTHEVDTATDAAYPDECTLCDYSAMPADGSHGAAYFLSFNPSNQGTIVYVLDGVAPQVYKATSVPASTHSGWIDYVSPYPGCSCLIDKEGARIFTSAGWSSYFTFASGATDYVALGKIPSTDPTAYPGGAGAAVYAFSPTHTAINVAINYTGANTWTEYAATWDGTTLPAGLSLMRPIWDTVRSQWVVGAAHVDTSADARSSAKIYVSSDGHTWTSYAGSPSFVLITGACVRGVLYAIGFMPDGGTFATGDSNGLECLASFDGGLTWLRFGEPGMITIGTITTSPALLVKSCRVMAGADVVAFSRSEGGGLDYVIAHIGAG